MPNTKLSILHALSPIIFLRLFTPQGKIRLLSPHYPWGRRGSQTWSYLGTTAHMETGRAETDRQSRSPNRLDIFHHLLSQSEEQSTQGIKLQSADWVKSEGPPKFPPWWNGASCGSTYSPWGYVSASTLYCPPTYLKRIENERGLRMSPHLPPPF